MKLFRTVYYSVLAVLVVALFTLSCVDIRGTQSHATGFTSAMTDAAVGHITKMTEKINSGSIYDTDAHAARVKYLTDTLKGFGLDNVTNTDEPTKPEIKGAKGGFASVKMTLTGADRYEWETAYYGKAPDAQPNGTTLTDVVAYLPATGANPTGKVVMMMAHYDSVKMGPGANDDLTSVAAMLETVKYLASGDLKYNNDFMFLFTDGEEFGMLGAYAFSKQFEGFNRDGKDAYSRVGLGANFESRGNDGTVIMFQSSANNYNLIKNWSKIRTTEFASSVADFAYSLMPNYTDFAVFGSEIPALNFANIGGGEVYHTQNDKVPSKTVINNHGAMMFGLVDAFGNTNLDALKDSSQSAVFFSYLDWGTVVYSQTVAYVLGALLLCLVAAGLVYAGMKKTLNLVAILKGLGVTVLTALLSVAFGYAAYYVIGSILALCGVFDIHALSSLMFSSIPLMVFSGLLVVAFAVFLNMFLKRLFGVKAGDVVRGNVVLWSLLGVILSFAAPTVSYLFVWVALFEALALLATAIFKPAYKAKFGEDMDRLFLHIVPVIFLLPMLLGLFLLLGDALGTAMYPIIMVLPVLFAGFITPYFDYLKNALDALVKKLPGASVRKVETVTVTVGELRKDPSVRAQAVLNDPDNKDIIKKGDSAEITYRKTVRSFEKLNYHNWHGVLALCLVGVITVFCFAGQKPAFADNIGGKVNFDRPYNDDAIVYVVDKDADAADSYYWMVGDIDAYQFIKPVQKMDWDAGLGKKGAYKLTDDANQSKGNANLPTVDNEMTDGNVTSFTVKPVLDTMRFSLTFTEAESIQSVTIRSWTNANESHEETYEPIGDKLIVDDLSGISTVSIKTTGTTAYKGDVVFDGKQIAYAFDEEIGDNTELRDFKGLWADVQSYYGDTQIAKYLKGGLQIKNYTLDIKA